MGADSFTPLAPAPIVIYSRLHSMFARAPDGEKLAAAHHCAFHDDYRDLANPRVDPVVVAVPPMLHPVIPEAACQAGKPLLVEKPLATSLAAAQRIASLVSASGVRAMVAHTLRFSRPVQTVQTRVLHTGVHSFDLNRKIRLAG